MTGSVATPAAIPGVGFDRGAAFGNRPGVCAHGHRRRADARQQGDQRALGKPESGARGTVTPIASAYTKDGATCRDFLASYVRRQGPETWLQGEACRAKQGAAWEVKSLRPWSRS